MDSTFHVVFSPADRLAQSIADGAEVQLESNPWRAKARLDVLVVAEGLVQRLSVAAKSGARQDLDSAVPRVTFTSRGPLRIGVTVVWPSSTS